MSEPKYKAGQFVSTPFGRMRARKLKSRHLTNSCNKCAIKDFEKCAEFEGSYGTWCIYIIPQDCYLEKV